MATKTSEKPKATERETVVLSVLIDESGSMGGNRQSVIESYNEFIANMRDADEAQGKDVRATLAMFDTRAGDDNVRIKHDGVPIAQVGEISEADYRPSGMTPLNDAIVETVKRVEKVEPDRALVVIVTDGYENASETSTEDVRKLVVAKEADGWRFIYMGANVDSFAEGASRGVAAGASMSYSSTPTGTRAAGQMMASKGSSYLAGTTTLDSDNAEMLADSGNVIPDPGVTQQADIAAQVKAGEDEARQRTKDKAKETADEAYSAAKDALGG